MKVLPSVGRFSVQCCYFCLLVQTGGAVFEFVLFLLKSLVYQISGGAKEMTFFFKTLVKMNGSTDLNGTHTGCV
jgi:hypothetical protein